MTAPAMTFENVPDDDQPMVTLSATRSIPAVTTSESAGPVNGAGGRSPPQHLSPNSRGNGATSSVW